MRPKTKALVLNFLAFSILFIGIRLLAGLFLSLPRLFLALGSAVPAMLLAPKFGVVRAPDKTEKVMVKWPFSKKSREV